VEKTVQVADVSGLRTKSGNIRFALRDEDGNEYTTFREAIGARALELEGRRARIEYHEAQRNGFTNVYLDAVEPVDESEADGDDADDGKVEEVAWKTAIEAAPYLLGDRKRAIPPDDLYGRVKPFKDLVAEDIRESGDE
jgi:hypothetical protein